MKTTLFRQYYIGGRPAQPEGGRLTANGLTVAAAPQPFAITFPGAHPLPAAQLPAPAPAAQPYYPTPGKYAPKQYVLQLHVGDGYLDTATVDFLVPDLRFSDAVMLPLEVAQAGVVRVTAEGIFRYSDRQPCWQAQWEDIIALREKVVPKERRPLQFAVQVDGQPAGMLSTLLTGEREVSLELAARDAGLKPKTVVEEVVLQASGEITLPAGKHQLLLIPQNIVDGHLNAVYVGSL